MNIEKRLAKIVVEADIAPQLSLAQAYVKTLRNKSKKLPTLSKKLAMNVQVKKAEETLCKIRRYAFDIEDALRNNKTALSVLNS